jgi:hypothetical protein
MNIKLRLLAYYRNACYRLFDYFDSISCFDLGNYFYNQAVTPRIIDNKEV